MPGKLLIPNKELTNSIDPKYRTDMETIERWANSLQFPSSIDSHAFGTTIGLAPLSVAANATALFQNMDWVDVIGSDIVPGGGPDVGFSFETPGVYLVTPQLYINASPLVTANTQDLILQGFDSSNLIPTYNYHFVTAGVAINGNFPFVNCSGSLYHINPANVGKGLGEWGIHNQGSVMVTDLYLSLGVVFIQTSIGPDALR